MLESWVTENIASGILPANLQPIINRRRPYPLRQYLAQAPAFHSDAEIDKSIRDMSHALRKMWRNELSAAEAGPDTETAKI